MSHGLPVWASPLPNSASCVPQEVEVIVMTILCFCRHISKAEVLETLKKGRINQRKSNPREVPCPKYVVDANVGKSKRSVQVRLSPNEDTRYFQAVYGTDFAPLPHAGSVQCVPRCH